MGRKLEGRNLLSRSNCREIACCEMLQVISPLFCLTCALQASAIKHLQDTLAAKIRQGAAKGSAAAEATSNEWAVHSNYHHATYKGVVRREGKWDHPVRGDVDWPEELAEPVYKSFSKQWRDLFGSILPQQINRVKSKLQEAMAALHEGVQEDVVQQGCRRRSEVIALQGGLDFSGAVSYRSLADKLPQRVKRISYPALLFQHEGRNV